MQQLDVFTLGEAMVILQPPDIGSLQHTPQLTKRFGGAEANVAVGLSRLGHKVAWQSVLGDDPFGTYILKALRGEGVDISSVTRSNEAPTGLLIKEQATLERTNVYYYRHGSAATKLSPEKLNVEQLRRARYLHITGITPAISETAYQTIQLAIEIAKEFHIPIVFDPNVRLKLWSKEKAQSVLKEIAQQSDIILPGLDEAELMTGCTTVETVVAALREDNPNRTVIVKLGEKGAYYAHEAETGYVDGYEVRHIVDPVGAGDGFAAGILSGLLLGLTMEETVRRGNAIGAIVVGTKGDIEGLPTERELIDFMEYAGDDRDVIR